jgi:hypothetical protein
VIMQHLDPSGSVPVKKKKKKKKLTHTLEQAKTASGMHMAFDSSETVSFMLVSRTTTRGYTHSLGVSHVRARLPLFTSGASAAVCEDKTV